MDVIMRISDVFSIPGQGIVATGTIESAVVSVGNEVGIQRQWAGDTIRATIAGIEKFRKAIETANTGDAVGLLLQGITKNDIRQGDIINSVSTAKTQNSNQAPRTSDILEYKCPQCGGAINFDSNTQQMVCPYCDATFDVEALKAMDEALNNSASAEPDWNMPAGEWQDGERENMAVYSCRSCGGEIVGDNTIGATSCPYCGNPVVMSGQFAGALRPDLIIPFKLDQAAAKAALKAHYKKKVLLPKAFKSQNHIDEVKGVYVPFWLFDCDVDANIHFDATKVRTWSDSNYNYVETSHYLVTREGDVAFDRVPVDGSSKMPDDLMESVEPFDYSAFTGFQTAYMAGYVADKYDVDAAASIGRANERIKHSTEAVFASSVEGYTTVTAKSSNVRIFDGGAKYALLPVWLLSTSWNKQQYLFAMNGQTGKLVGDLPMDKGAFWAWLGGVAAGVAALVYLVTMFVL